MVRGVYRTAAVGRLAISLVAAALLGPPLAGCVNEPRELFTAEDVAPFCDSYLDHARAKVRECGYREIEDVYVLERFLALCRAHEASGRIDTERAVRCVVDLDGERCPDLPRSGLPADCSAVLVGSAAVGQACAHERDCAVGAFCKTSGASCGGICTARAAAQAECEAGAWGARSCGPGTQCISGRCRGAGVVGEACALDSCRPELVCGRASECVAATPIGETCFPGECADGLVCEGGQCVDGLAVTEPCSRGSECLSGLCSGGACRSWPRSGDACSPTEPCQEGGCAGGVCGVVTSTCS